MRVLQNAIRIVRRGLLKLIQNSCAIRSSTKCLIEWKAVFLALYFIVNAPSPKTCFCLQNTTVTFDETKGDDSLIYILWFRVRSPGVLYSSNFLPSSDHTCEFEEHTNCQIFWIYMNFRVYHWWLLKYSCSAFCLAHNLDYSRNNLVTNHFHLQLV